MAGTDTPLENTIETAAGMPQDVNVDGTVTKLHSLRDQIEADKYLQGLAARKQRKLPIRFFRIQPGGAA